jgi:predicted nucleic acid-binding Zn ribbon protein
MQDPSLSCSLTSHSMGLVTRFSPCTGTKEVFGVVCRCGEKNREFEVLQKMRHDHFHKAQRAWERMRRVVSIQANAISPDGTVMPIEKMEKFANATVAIKKYIDYNLDRSKSIEEYIEQQISEILGDSHA